MEHILNENFLLRYIEDVKNEIENGTHKIIFIWLKKEVLEMLERENIKFIVATWNEKEDGIEDSLRDLYVKRGNPDDWIKKVLKYLYVINEYAEEKGLETIALNKNKNIAMRLKGI